MHVAMSTLFFESMKFLEQINISGNPIFFCYGFMPKRKKPACVCCKSHKGTFSLVGSSVMVGRSISFVFKNPPN